MEGGEWLRLSRELFPGCFRLRLLVIESPLLGDSTFQHRSVSVNISAFTPTRNLLPSPPFPQPIPFL